MKKLLVIALLFSSIAHADLTNLDSYIFDSNGNAINLGQTTMANGVPVSLASNQTAIPVSQSGSWTNACTQSGTWTVQQGGAPWSINQTQWNGVAVSVGAGTTGTGTVRVASNIYDGSGNAITSNASNSNRVLHVTVPDTTAASTALGALNATISISLQGLQSSGFQLAAGTLIGTIIPEASVDGGTTWTSTLFYNPANQSTTSSVVFASSNTQQILGIVGFPGISNVRVRVSAYTSGTANAQMRAAYVTGSSPSTTISAAFTTAIATYPALSAGVAAQVIASNSNRKYLAIANNGNQTMHCQFGTITGLTATTGLPLASATYYEFKGDNLYTGPVFCIVSGTIAVTVTEGTP